VSIQLERYDSTGARLCAALPFDRNSPAKAVPGFRYDGNWLGANGGAPARKVWHWPIQSLPVLLRAFPDIVTIDAMILSAIERANQLNAARALTMERARALAAGATLRDGVRTATGKTLRAHQIAACQAALAAGGSRGILHQTGTGKTPTAATLVSLLTQPENGLRKAVIVCPVTLIEAAWIPDLKEWFPELPVVNLRAYPKGQKRELAVAAAIRTHGRVAALINYESMRTDPSVRRIMAGAYVVFDEVSKCKGVKSSISIVAREIAATFRGCVLLSGTPAPNGNQEYWPLAKIIAPAAGYDPFPGGHSAFVKEFCDVKTFQRRGQPGVKHFAGFEFRDEMAARIHERLSPICEWVKKEQCLDLPPKVFQRVPIELSKDTASAYEEMRDAMMVSIGKKYDDSEKLRAHAKNALAQMMKLRQITAGYVPAHKEDWIAGSDAASSRVLVPIGREKIDWLLEHCETDTERIVIWTQFIFEAKRYVEALREAKVPCESITGETPESDRANVFKGFVAGHFQVLVAHPGVAQWGVSFPGISLAAYGSLSYSLQEYAQSQDRIHGIGRGDATKHSTYYLLTARVRGAETIDADCVDVLEGKRDALDLVFDIDRKRRAAGFVASDTGQTIDA